MAPPRLSKVRSSVLRKCPVGIEDYPSQGEVITHKDLVQADPPF
jgi:hypothetical protein